VWGSISVCDYGGWCRVSSVGVTTRVRVGLFGVRLRAGGNIFFSFSKRPETLWGSFLGVKRPGSDLNYSPLSSDKVKNEWSYTSDSPVYHRGVDRENIIFTFAF
jgi:hypothetical protein